MLCSTTSRKAKLCRICGPSAASDRTVITIRWAVRVDRLTAGRRGAWLAGGDQEDQALRNLFRSSRAKKRKFLHIGVRGSVCCKATNHRSDKEYWQDATKCCEMLTLARAPLSRRSCDVVWNQMLVRSSYQVAPQITKKRNKCRHNRARRTLPNGASRSCLDRLSNRLTKIVAEARNIATP